MGPFFYVPNTTAVDATSEVGAGNNGIPSKLYHYTNEAGMQGILDPETLNPSLKAINPNDVRYGNGQYLSGIAPGTMTPAQLSRAFINNPFQGARYTNFIEIDTTGLNVIQGRPGERSGTRDLGRDLGHPRNGPSPTDRRAVEERSGRRDLGHPRNSLPPTDQRAVD